VVDVRNSRAWNDSVAKFEENTMKRFKEVAAHVRLFSNRTQIAARTAAYSRANGILVDEFNSIVVRIAKHLNMLPLDFNAFVWSTVSFNRTIDNESQLFRDAIHPRRNLTVGWTNHLLELCSSLS